MLMLYVLQEKMEQVQISGWLEEIEEYYVGGLRAFEKSQMAKSEHVNLKIPYTIPKGDAPWNPWYWEV